jgi:hypothetical protein
MADERTPAARMVTMSDTYTRDFNVAAKLVADSDAEAAQLRNEMLKAIEDLMK